MQHILTNLAEITKIALEKEAENDAFKDFLKGVDVDAEVLQLNDTITPQIDCTQCGNCCKSLMINVSEDELTNLATHLQTGTDDLKNRYLETGSGGMMIINQIPCHFLSDNKCTIYENRFSGCREFPHLDQPGFTGRLFSIFMYYSLCPIIFNVVEALKTKTGFKN